MVWKQICTSRQSDQEARVAGDFYASRLQMSAASQGMTGSESRTERTCRRSRSRQTVTGS
jgi:hypothetical protein